MMHPRRLTGTAGNIARYYTIGDYYTKGGTEGSQWGGELADELGLSGEVDPKTFETLLRGEVAGQQLGRHRKEGIEHHPGWDFALSAPKSVSVIALAVGDTRIATAHERAVSVALSWLEEQAQLRRREEGTVRHETTGRLLWARFTEHASRELDPHLHTHVVVLNMTNRERDAPMSSLETRAMYSEQMSSGQIYRNELAHGLRTLGYEIAADPRRGLFEIRGVPKELVAEMSQRAEQIDAHAREHGLEGQAARRQSFYATRGPKEKIGLEALHLQWRARLGEYAPALDSLRQAAERREGRTIMVAPADSARAALFGIRQTEGREAVNPFGRFLANGLAAHVGEVRFRDVRPLIDEHEARRKLLATREQTGDQILNRGRTTRRSARFEQALALHLALSIEDGRPIASADRLLASLDRAGLSPMQERALVDMALSRDRVTALHGVAGSGKSTLIATLRAAAEPGSTLHALAPTSSAAANLGDTAGIGSRTVASLLAEGGYGLSGQDVLILDEAGQLGNRQALRVLEISRATGARLVLLGDNKQTGAIEQGKAFWLMQQLGMPTSQLTESRRQETARMKDAVARARAGDYAGSLEQLDKVVAGADAEALAKGLVGEWTRLRPETRATTNILVLDNATRLVVNTQVRETLQREGVVAAQDSRLSILAPAGFSEQEKHLARFYSSGQIVTFGRAHAEAGLARDAEYRVLGNARDERGRPIVRLVDEHGRVIRWDPRLTKAGRVNVFVPEIRDLAQGDRIQWRLVAHELGIKNAQRGTVERLDGAIATIRWDKADHTQEIDLAKHKSWDHGYAETIYSAQSRTYARVYVLAPIGSPLVTAQNYYTAITRARLGVKLWTQDKDRLVDKLERASGEKTSAIEGLGRLERDRADRMAAHNPSQFAILREDQELELRNQADRWLGARLVRRSSRKGGLAARLASNAQNMAEAFDRHLTALGLRAGAQEQGSDRTTTNDVRGGGRDGLDR
ncbi:MobF family relaxase [Sphingobium sp. AN558]|uniref:MobF family relaxase n=1 Tax=Sphingobium sp. AN558 TaxID=3133442 RepID=UPI0030C13FB9